MSKIGRPSVDSCNGENKRKASQLDEYALTFLNLIDTLCFVERFSPRSCYTEMSNFQVTLRVVIPTVSQLSARLVEQNTRLRIFWGPTPQCHRNRVLLRMLARSLEFETLEVERGTQHWQLQIKTNHLTVIRVFFFFNNKPAIMSVKTRFFLYRTRLFTGFCFNKNLCLLPVT